MNITVGVPSLPHTLMPLRAWYNSESSSHSNSYGYDVLVHLSGSALDTMINLWPPHPPLELQTSPLSRQRWRQRRSALCTTLCEQGELEVGTWWWWHTCPSLGGSIRGMAHKQPQLVAGMPFIFGLGGTFKMD
jgi:hypothetical protein